MAPKESHKTSPCLLAQLEKILRHFMGPGEVSERDTHRTTISRLDGKSTPLLLLRIPELVGWVRSVSKVSCGLPFDIKVGK